MTQTLLIAQISDTHIASYGEKAYGVAPTAENLRRCIENINQLIPKPDCVLLTGDVTNSSQKDEYEQAEQLLKKLEMPYFVIPGNHDHRATIKSTFHKHCPVSDKQVDKQQQFIHYVVDDFAIRLIAMDSTIPENAGGKLCDTRLSWLEEQLSKDSNKPTIIFMHHPPIKLGVRESDVDGFIGANELGELVAKYNNIERIICGHVHLQTHTRWNGTIVTTAPSVGMELVLDLTLKKDPQFVIEPPSYLLHYWTKYGNLVTHTMSARETDGPYLFEEQ